MWRLIRKSLPVCSEVLAKKFTKVYYDHRIWETKLLNEANLRILRTYFLAAFLSASKFSENEIHFLKTRIWRKELMIYILKDRKK